MSHFIDQPMSTDRKQNGQRFVTYVKMKTDQNESSANQHYYYYYLFLSRRPYPGRLTIVTRYHIIHYFTLYRYHIIFTYNYPFIQLGFYWSNLGKVPCSRVQQQCPPLGIEPTTLRSRVQSPNHYSTLLVANATTLNKFIFKA